MSVTTKTGDNGMTSLYLEGRIWKDDLRVDIYGTLDELCSFLGLSKSLIRDRKTKRLIESTQKDLFVIGAEIATKGRFITKLEERIKASHIRTIEKAVRDIESVNVFEGCCFYLPGEDLVSSTLDIARTVARRAERGIVTLKRKGMLKNNNILIYLNRLSDLLYLLARTHEKNPRKLKP